MKRKKGIWLDIVQTVLSFGIIGMTVLLILDMKRYKICFSISFGLAVLLLVGRMIAMFAVKERKKSKIWWTICYLCGIAIMIGLFTGSVLTFLGV